MKPCLMVSNPLDQCYLCQDCGVVGNCSTACPGCASGALMCLQAILDRPEEATGESDEDWRITHPA